MLKRSKPMKRGQPLRARSPMKRAKPSRGECLGHKVVKALGGGRPAARKEASLLRSETHRRNVAALGCLITGKPAQACHPNFDKGGGMKACDSLCFPLCPDLHRAHDQGGIPKDERRRREFNYANWAREELISRGLWTTTIERHFQRAIAPLKRLVRGDSSL
ncbi:hypothetical protein [Achromobacter insuavis]|uniref:hypothetical protein n=2 Tax=Achromobacter TaxID=222 RepID=UPI0035A1519C